jgi:enoyl-CoA hydratase
LLPDITIASPDAWFQMPHVHLMGLPGAETMMEPWLFMNWKRTYEYLYTKPRLTAEEALDFGLVNRVVDRDNLEAEAQALAAEIATAPLTALRATKLMVKRAWELMGMRAHLQWSNDMLTVAAHHTDTRERVHQAIADLQARNRG